MMITRITAFIVAMVSCEINISGQATLKRENNDNITGMGSAPYELPNHHPWMAYLKSITDNEQYCVATLINEWVLLTPADCANRVPAYRAKVRMGSYDNPWGSLIQYFMAAKPFDCGNKTSSNLAIVVLQTKAPLDKMIKLMPMYGAKEEIAEKTSVRRIGCERPFGVLQSLKPAVVSGNECSKIHDLSVEQFSGHICASTPGTKCCPVDGGYPLISQDSRLIGISAWNHDCDKNPDYPGVYTKISTYRGWIDERVKQVNNDNRNVMNDNGAQGVRINNISFIIIVSWWFCQ